MTHIETKRIEHYMCPECLTVYRGLVCRQASIESLDDKQFKVLDSPIYIYCEECGEYAFIIDEAMIDPIYRLNFAGFKTLFSCAGHYISNGKNNNMIDHPYIAFDNSVKQLKWIFGGEGKLKYWYIEDGTIKGEKKESNVIRVQNKFLYKNYEKAEKSLERPIPIDAISFKKLKEDYMKELDFVVSTLEECVKK